jgi:putative ABC transport system permease protein
MFAPLLRDVRDATRALLSAPTYAVVTIATLALVIGAASAVLAVVNRTMIRPLPFPDGDRIVQVFSMPPGVNGVAQRNPLHPRVFFRFRNGGLRLVDSLEGIWARERVLGGEGEPESVSAAAASPGMFALFGGVTLAGRTWSEDEDRANARVVVLSYDLWQRRFGGDAKILGHTVLIDREAHEVIGIMPRDFLSASVQADFWTPLNIHPGVLDNAATFIQTFARLRTGATIDQLASEVKTAIEPVIAESPAMLGGWTAEVATLRDAQFGQQRSSVLVLLAGVVALTLIACTNLANLTLAHVTSRRSEMALRAALGAGRIAILRLQLVETLMLVATGAVAGLIIGAWTLPALLALDPTAARVRGDVTIDGRVQALTGVLAFGVAVLAGAVPAVRELRGDVSRSLADGSRRAAGSRRHARLRHLLVATESAMAVVLLVCGALLFGAFDRTSRVHPGFEPAGIFGAQLRLTAAAYATEPSRAQFVAQVLERVRAIPGVTAASTTLNPFVPGFAFVTLVRIEGKPTPTGEAHTVQFRRVSPDYFNTLRIPMLRGRDFSDADGPAAPSVAVISRSFAARFWPDEDPLGRRIQRGAANRLFTVIGVVEDVSDVGFGQAPAPTLYVTYAQNNVATAPVSLVARVSGDPLAVTNAVRAAVLSVDPAQPIDHVTTLDQFMSDSLGPQRFRSTLLIVLGALGVAIAAVGIYGVTARAVAERTRELGVRLALGATPTSVAGLVIGSALGAVCAGFLAGVGLAVAAGMVLIHTLPSLERAEAWTAVPALVALGVVALAAAAIPARRAIALDPVTALRGE